MHPVICIYCKEKFDRDKEPTTQISLRRYAHKDCAEKYLSNKTQEEKDIEALEKYIMKLFNESYVNARVRKQLKDFREQYNFTYSGMLKTLIYWFEIKGNSTEKTNGGVGIIPYVYKDALQYYYNLYLIKLANSEKDVQKYKPKEKIIEISPPKISPKHIRLLFEDEVYCHE